ncbi:MAG: methyl-accepting chemotaxis protein [Desulfuromonadales bacterium]|nr:methyl-accepting chemotaxis protein [Desulfuromonadales bacterium]
MTIKSKLYISSFISIIGIIGISVLSLVTITMVKDKITLLTSQSTPLQVKTVQFQQTVEKLSADLLQLGLSNDQQDVKQISASITRNRENLEKIHTEINNLKKMPLETDVFSELHDQVLKATDEKFKSMALFHEETAKVNNAMSRVDKSLVGLKDIISGLISTASRRTASATKTLNETISDKSSVPDMLANVQNYRNEVDHDVELNKRINAINDIVYSIGVDAKLLDAKARMVMLSGTPAELDRATAEIQTTQARIARNVNSVGKAVREIKSSGFVDDTIASINAAVGSAGTSLRTIAASQRKVLETMAFVEQTTRKIKDVAMEQSRKSEANVQTTALEQGQFVKIVGERVDMFKTLLVVAALSIIALALVLSISTVVSINRSLKTMTDTIVLIAETGDFTKTITIKNKDEFGTTMQAFNTLIASFTRIISTVSHSSTQLTASSHDLTGTAQTIHTSIDSQASSISQVSAATQEMSQTVTMITNNVTRIAESAMDAREVAISGADVVARTGREVQEIARAVEESTGFMRTLQEHSQQVGEIVDVIVEITDQTNLLALNAAIEAARAGDYGRGFAVVAGEVRKLANNTAEATVGITERIKRIQADTHMAVNAMQNSLGRVKLGVEYSDQAGNSLRKIVDSVATLQEMTGEISAATSELAHTADEISSDIVSIEKSSSETLQAAACIAKESETLTRLAIDQKNEISRFTFQDDTRQERLAPTTVQPDVNVRSQLGRFAETPKILAA